ncbi:small, acid-soluble spore protein, alpha/beta type [Desulfuribacillus alkaliarsenatis]|uniref:small, acid-soluble spore protein, alpha/beta type n=1 Tax=Desulfuribacillus alkaliarsenatis TaxID=766136 RepID=UPI0015B3C26E|nr:small, acid-soluble spore protein, alpha/beta type [Desulfuribacillus alkaliarsenatis]
MNIEFDNLSELDRERLKYELAKNIGVKKYLGDDWGDISSKQCGIIGQKMRGIKKRVKK